MKNIIKRRIKQGVQTLKTKNLEYTSKTIFDNFDNAASIFWNGCREDAIIGMMAKHFVSVLTIMTGEIQIPITQKLIDEKFGDLFNYLFILKASFLSENTFIQDMDEFHLNSLVEKYYFGTEYYGVITPFEDLCTLSLEGILKCISATLWMEYYLMGRITEVK